jgi:hypothetical protein
MDLGGSPEVRKFWPKLVGAADAILVVANASEADDLAWSMLGRDVRAVCEQLPVLVLANRQGVAAHTCLTGPDAVERLGLDGAAYRLVHAVMLAASDDAAAVEGGLDWLCTALRQVAELPPPPAAEAPAESPAAVVAGPASVAPAAPPVAAPDVDEPAPAAPAAAGGSKLRVMRTLRDAQSHAAQEAEEVAAAQARVMAGHLLSERDLELLRTVQRDDGQ